MQFDDKAALLNRCPYIVHYYSKRYFYAVRCLQSIVTLTCDNTEELHHPLLADVRLWCKFIRQSSFITTACQWSWRHADRLRIDRRRQRTPSSLVDIDHRVSQQSAAIATSRRQPQPPHRRRPTTHNSLTPTSHTVRRHARLRLRHCNEYSSPHQQLDDKLLSQPIVIAEQLSIAPLFHVNICNLDK